jgi:hypothetical protein
VDGDGDQDVLVGSSITPVLLLNAGGASFMIAGPAWGLTPPLPLLVDLADLDGDGDLDIVAVGYGGPTIVRSNLGGSFGPPLTVSMASPGTFFIGRPVVADLDGDGLKEILLRGGAAGSSQLFRQTAPFVFAVVATLPGFGADPTKPIGATAGDFDGDGVAELALATADGVTFSSLVGGALVPHGPTIPRVFNGLGAFDADGDGDPDLFAQGRYLEIGFNDGAGSFLFPERALKPLPWTSTFDGGDFDGDGDLDVVGYRSTAPDGSATAPVVALNRGDGTFADPADLPCVGCPPLGYGAGGTTPFKPKARAFDSDLDGDLDLVVIRTGNATGSVDLWLRNDGVAGFVAVPLAPPPAGMTTGSSFVATDLDADGDRDLVCTSANGSAFVRYNLGASFGPSVALPISNLVSDIAAGDLDGDGDPDLVFPRSFPTFGWSVVQNNVPQGGGFVAGPAVPGAPMGRVIVADLDGNGMLDVVGNTGTRWLNLGGLAFGPGAAVLPGAPPTLQFVGAFDLEGDGDVDLFPNPLNGSTTAVNLGGGTFVSGGSAPFANDVYSLADFDGDGDADVLVNGPNLLAGTTRHLMLRRPARPGRLAGFDVYGPPNGAWLVAAVLAPAVFSSTATPYGGLALDPGLAVIVAAGSLDVAGSAVVEGAMPSSPVAALVGAEFLFQAVVDGGAGPRLTNPHYMRVLDY